jgi:hypothetical protein
VVQFALLDRVTKIVSQRSRKTKPQCSNYLLLTLIFSASTCMGEMNCACESQVPQRAMWPVLIVIGTPGFDDELCRCERGELMHVQKFGASCSPV